MVATISISFEPPSVQVQAGSRASARLTLFNRGDTVGQYALSVSGVDPSWCKLDSAQVGVFPADRSSVQLALRLPADALAATYRVVVSAQNQLDAADQVQSTLELTVTRGAGAAIGAEASASDTKTRMAPRSRPPQPVEAVQSQPPSGGPSAAAVFGEVAAKAVSTNGQVQLVADRTEFRLAPGATQSMHLGLTNSGGVALNMELSVKGAPLGWFSIQPSAFALAPGESQYATLAAAIPAQTPLGSYPLTLQAQSSEDPALAVRINQMLEVVRAGDLTLELSPGQAQGEQGGEFQVRISQTGQQALPVNLSAKDTGGQLDFSFSPPVLQLPAAGVALSRLLVRPRQALTASESAAISFEVSAAPGSGGSAPVSAQARFIQLRAAPAKLLLPTEDLRDPAGGAFPLRIVNPGTQPITYRLSAADAGGACQYQFDPPSLNVPGGAEAASMLRVSALTFLPAGEMVYTVQVTAQPMGPGTSLSGQLRFIQTAGQPPVIAITPGSQTSPGPASFWVQVTNPRSVPIQITLQPYDASQQCRFVIDPPSLNIPAQYQATSRLEVTPLGELLSGETKRILAFGVAGYVDGLSAPITAEGSLLLVHGFTWRKLLPVFLIAFILLGLGLIAVLALFYLRYMQ